MILNKKLILGLGSELTYTSDRFQRYLDGPIDVNVTFDGREVYVYAKLRRLLIFGFLETPQDSYRASRISLQAGTLGPGAYQLPAGIIAALTQNAEAVFSSLGSLSKRQRRTIDESVLRAKRVRLTE